MLNYELSKLGKIRYLDFPSGVYRFGVGEFSSSSNMHEKNLKVKEYMNKDYILYVRKKKLNL